LCNVNDDDDDDDDYDGDDGDLVKSCFCAPYLTLT